MPAGGGRGAWSGLCIQKLIEVGMQMQGCQPAPLGPFSWLCCLEFVNLFDLWLLWLCEALILFSSHLVLVVKMKIPNFLVQNVQYGLSTVSPPC